MTLAVHPTNLPDGAIGYPYDAALAGSGGIDPYSFTISRGALPPGVALSDAVISGTPSLPGSFSFTVMTSDATAAVATRSYTVNVFPLAPAVVVEDGSIVDGANSYLALADLYVNQAALGIGAIELSALNNLNETTQANLLVWGTSYLDRRFRFYGQPLQQGQPLQWPRTRNWDDWGYPIDPGTIPTQLQKGLAFLTTAAAANPNLLRIENTAYPLRQSGWSMDGVSMQFAGAPSTTATNTLEGAISNLFEANLPDLLVILRSIGEAKDLSWVTTDRQTVVAR